MSFVSNAIADYFSLPDDSDTVDFPNGDWTIGGMFYSNDGALGTGESSYFWELWDEGGTPHELDFYLDEASGSDYLWIYIKSGGAGDVDLQWSTAWTYGTTYRHILVRRSGTTYTLWVNGTQEDSVTNAAIGAIEANGNPVVWAQYANLAGGAGDVPTDAGYAEWGKWNRALSEAEIVALSNGLSPQALPRERKWYMPCLREYQEIDTNATVTTSGITIGNHPPIIYPTGGIFNSAATTTETQAVSGASTNAGALTNLPQPTLDGASTNDGALTNLPQKDLDGASTNAGALLPTVEMPVFTGASTNSGILTPKLVELQDVTGNASTNSGVVTTKIAVVKDLLGNASTNSGDLVNLIQAAKSGTSANSGLLTNLPQKDLTGASTNSGALTPIAIVMQDLTGNASTNSGTVTPITEKLQAVSGASTNSGVVSTLNFQLAPKLQKLRTVTLVRFYD